MDDKRKITLLKAAYDFLTEIKKSPYWLEVLSTTVHYDDTECDGFCLCDDIRDELMLDEWR